MSKILKSNSKKILSMFMALVLLFIAMVNCTIVGAADEGWTNVNLKDPNLYYHGRTFDIDKSVGIDWSSSGVSFNVKATDVKMTFTANGSPWLQVFVDGERTNRIQITNGEYEIATGLNPEKVTEIKVVNSSESNFNFAAISKISIKGELVPIERKNYKIEVIGDSISAGQWMTAASNATQFNLEEEDSTLTYASLLADKFDADFTLLASSGAGVYVDSSGLKSGQFNTDNNKPANIWADMYEHAVTARSARGVKRGIKSEDWDFTNDNPDLIIVNLGTNDASKAPKEAGTELDEFNNGITTAVDEFLTLLTTKHPNAKIVWCYGIMNKTLTTVIKTAVENFAKTNSNVSFIELPAQSTFSSTTGGGNHPNVETHSKLADYLYNKLRFTDSHSQIDYTVPVLTSDTVSGNTIYTLEKSVSTWGAKYFSTNPVNLEGNTGIRYSWTAIAASGVRNGMNTKFDFDGVSVKLANIGDTQNTTSRYFALVFADTNSKDYPTDGVLRIRFDGNKNTVYADLNGASHTVFTNAEIFAAMPNNTVYVDIKKADNKTDYQLTLTAGDKIASGTILATHLSGFNLDSSGKCYVILSAVNITNQSATTIDFLGVGNTKVNVLEYSNKFYYYKPADGTTANTYGNPSGGALRYYYYNDTTSASMGVKATISEINGLGRGVDISVNGFNLHLQEGNSTLNGEAIDVPTNDIGIYDFILKVEPIFDDKVYSTKITAEVNGVAHSVNAISMAEKTFEGIVIDNSVAGQYLYITRTTDLTLVDEDSGYIVDKANRVLFVTDKEIATINSKITTNQWGHKFVETETVKTGTELKQKTSSAFTVYTISLKDDVNGDGNTNITDLVRLKKAQDELVELTMAQKYSVGINETGVVSDDTMAYMRELLLN